MRRRQQYRVGVLVGALVLAIGLSACGSSSSSSSSGSNAPWWKNVNVTDLRGKAVGGQYPSIDVDLTDNEFTPRIVRIDPGVTVVWTNHGRSVHNILKSDNSVDFGKQFGVDSLSVDAKYQFTFKRPGVYDYYCSLHGNPMSGMNAMVVVGDVDISTGKVASGAGPTESGTLRVGPNEKFHTIQTAVDAAKPGSLVLIDKGVYHEQVSVNAGHENIVIRGVDRNETILDGRFDEKTPNGFLVQADGVAIENLTARNYVTNGFFWRGVTGYRGSYLNSYRTGDYGIYAFDSEVGQFDHDFAVGSRDAGYYIGQCSHCRAVITDSVSQWNGLGYSGTNAGGDLYIVHSTWRFNRAGIVPNSETGEKLFPQRRVTIAGNVVYSNNNVKTPAIDIATTALGNGILVAGGHDDLVEHNLVYDHDVYGIGLITLPEKFLDPNNTKAINFEAIGNTIRNNTVRGSRVADLALMPSLERPNKPQGNCFSGNTFTTSSPANLETTLPCDAPAGAFAGDLKQFVALFTADKPKEVDYRTSPLPPLPTQPNMPDPMHAPVRPANHGVPMHVDIAAITTPKQ